MPLGFDPVNPGGINENSPAFQFQRWDGPELCVSPEGMAEVGDRRPSLRDLNPLVIIPGLKRR